MSLSVLRRTLALAIALAACIAMGRQTLADDGPYHFTGRVRLGVPAIAHVFDPANGRLYSTSAAFPRGVFVTNTVQPGIADRFGETPFGSIDIAPDLNELFILSPTEHRLRVIDLGTRRTLRTFDAPAGDAVFFEPSRQDLYVVGTDHKKLTVISSRNGQPLGTIKLAGEPSYILGDRVTKRIYVRLIDEHAIQVIDPTERAIVATWKTDTFRGSTMAVDANAHHLFVSAADSVLMLDTGTGQELAKMKLDYRVLGLACDPASGMLMASTGVGLVIARVEGQALTPVQTVSVGINGSYLFFDPRSRNVLAVSSEQAPSVEGSALPQLSSTLLTFEHR